MGSRAESSKSKGFSCTWDSLRNSAGEKILQLRSHPLGMPSDSNFCSLLSDLSAEQRFDVSYLDLGEFTQTNGALCGFYYCHHIQCIGSWTQLRVVTVLCWQTLLFDDGTSQMDQNFMLTGSCVAPFDYLSAEFTSWALEMCNVCWILLRSQHPESLRLTHLCSQNLCHKHRSINDSFIEEWYLIFHWVQANKAACISLFYTIKTCDA